MLAALLPLVPLLAQVVPQIASWIGGDDAEDVARQVTGVVSAVTGGIDESALAAAMADPAQRAVLTEQLARIAADRDRVREEAITTRLQAALADTASARQQTVQLAASGSRLAWAPMILSTLVLVGFFVCIVLIFVSNKQWDERQANIINGLFGTLTAAFGAVIQYWLGTARDSAAKDERQQAALSLATDSARRVMDTAPVIAAAAATSAAAAATNEAVRPLFPSRG